jgi:phosphoribosyl-ATP pyrophosphohydrolase
MSDILKRLEVLIRERRVVDPAESYVASLYAKGSKKIAEKVGEEAVETVIAAVSGSKAELTSEVADLLFHLLIMLADNDLSLADIEVELARREGISGHDEKAARGEG